MTNAAEAFKKDLPQNLKSSADAFVKIHSDLVQQAASEKNPSLSRDELYSSAYDQLDEFSDAVLLGSGEEQGDSIRATTSIIRPLRPKLETSPKDSV